jgi:hypothetical protein
MKRNCRWAKRSKKKVAAGEGKTCRWAKEDFPLGEKYLLQGELEKFSFRSCKSAE